MLELKQITKDYPAGAGIVHALKGVTLQFRDSEFVSILGPSGCGKTTLLNIVGGLDKYTEGDLVINGVSTKEYKDRDWDSYRNHSVGFVFQSYNLIPHQTVLQNVEIALTLSGVGKAERKQRAIEALEAVGLGDQIHKRPNAMSGGQMQRVAIARALVNNPEIILADEPTGALDTETSVQVMEILKEVSKERLVVMVTHNPELAEQYSSRIIRMLDGNIIGDSSPLTEEEIETARKAEEEKNAETVLETDEEGEPVKIKKKKKEKKPSMSFFTAFRLSLKNLFTKKGRTTLTSFAGSIGIIGIALILAVSQGTTAYIDHVQETTLSSYPLTLESSTMDLTSLMQSLMNMGKDKEDHTDEEAIYKESILTELVNAFSQAEATKNDLTSFKGWLEEEMANEDSKLHSAVSGVQYTYDFDLSVYTKGKVDAEGTQTEIIKSDTTELFIEVFTGFMAQGMGMSGSTGATEQGGGGSMLTTMMMGGGMWQELLPGENGEAINDFIYHQYDKIAGYWPNKANEVLLVVNENNEVDDLTLYALGLLSKAEIDEVIGAIGSKDDNTDKEDNKIEFGGQNWSFKEILGREYRVLLDCEFYDKNDLTGLYEDKSTDKLYLESLYNDASKGFNLTITGIIRPNKDAETHMLKGSLGYTYKLTEEIIKKTQNSDVVKAQLASKDKDVITGQDFRPAQGTLTNAQKNKEFQAYAEKLSETEKAELYTKIYCTISAEELKTRTDAKIDEWVQAGTLQDELANLFVAVGKTMGYGEITKEQAMGFVSSVEDVEKECRTEKTTFRQVIEASVSMGYMQEKAMELMTSGMTDAQKAEELDAKIAECKTNDDLGALYYDSFMDFSDSTYEENMLLFGYAEIDKPATINLYASSFENKDVIKGEIDRYGREHKGKEIAYTDYVGEMMSSITTIINAITYVLIAFVAISLIVSSIMIGVITLISVQERTKEIGILRAIGASKNDVSSMFNAETLIIGFTSGLLGIAVTYILCIPINLILHALTGIATLSAFLNPWSAVILVLISMGLTLISGLIPSRSAAKKDPVVALRTE